MSCIVFLTLFLMFAAVVCKSAMYRWSFSSLVLGDLKSTDAAYSSLTACFRVRHILNTCCGMRRSGNSDKILEIRKESPSNHIFLCDSDPHRQSTWVADKPWKLARSAAELYNSWQMQLIDHPGNVSVRSSANRVASRRQDTALGWCCIFRGS